MTTKTPAPKSKPVAKRAPARAAAPAKAAPAPEPAAPIEAAPPQMPVAKPAITEAPAPAAVVEPLAETPAPAAAPALTIPPEIVPPAAPVSQPAAAAVPAPVAEVTTPPKPQKDKIMATAFETTQDAVKNTVNTLNAQTEAAVNNGKAAMEQVAAKSKEAVEASIKSLDELSDMARANVDALIASARVATTGVEQVMTHLTEVTKKSFEETTAMVKGLAAAKTPNELMQLQSDFAKAQFDQAVAEYGKLSEMMVKLAGEVMEPVQNQMAVATDKMKSAFNTK